MLYPQRSQVNTHPNLGPIPSSKQYSRLVAPDTPTPVPPRLLILVPKVSLGGLNERGQSLRVLGSDVLEGDDGGGLLVDDCAETGLVLDDDVGDAHLREHEGR